MVIVCIEQDRKSCLKIDIYGHVLVDIYICHHILHEYLVDSWFTFHFKYQKIIDQFCLSLFMYNIRMHDIMSRMYVLAYNSP